MPALAFYLDAPMQSWGASSKYQYRETESFPTKSAIIGLVAAALGVDKHDSGEAEKIAPLTALRLTAVKLEKIHNTSRLMDFHTVGGGYDKSASIRDKMSIPKKASGAPFGTVITRRSYLTDSSFAAILEGDNDILLDIQKALKNPVWGVWFGRKTCLPATPLTPIIADSSEKALEALIAKLPGYEPKPLEQYEYQKECESSNTGDGTFYQSDQPIAYGQHHGPVPTAYRARPIYHHRPSQ